VRRVRPRRPDRRPHPGGLRIPFKAHDERTLERQHAVYHDETQLIQT
jgi:hypothetical protein